jgi:hypothetical protein
VRSAVEIFLDGIAVSGEHDGSGNREMGLRVEAP